ncbi:hypothetical protein ABDB91_11650 [Desulfoscipio sp. XC116]|uniref:hypothetical protein n=1 Tax=Desulfoscipio sp. XC116 TaxID=3144975 RepID=UPI00325BB584
MSKIFTAILLLLGLVQLFGCSIFNGKSPNDSNNSTIKINDTNHVIDSSNYEKDIIELIKNNIKNDFENTDLTIKEINPVENYSFVIFLIKQNNILHEGLACIEKEHKFYKLNEMDIAKVDLKAPFTKHTIISSLNDGRDYILIGGYINDENINEVHIEYKNSAVNVIEIGQNQNTYMNYMIGDIKYIKEIVGFNETNKIYSYEF